MAAANALDRQQVVFGFGTIRSDRFPSSSYQNRADWRKHFAWAADANRWDDEQARMVLPTCLTGWALDEFTSMPAHYREEMEGFEPPTLAAMLAELDHRMIPFQTQAGARAEFQNLMQSEKEGLREFSRRVRSLGDVANGNVGAQARDAMNREQFIDGLFDVELQDHLLREDLGNLAQAVARAQALDLVNKSSRARNRKRLHLARVAEGIPEPTAEPSVRSGLSGRAPQVVTSSGRQPVGTDPRIDQLGQTHKLFYHPQSHPIQTQQLPGTPGNPANPRQTQRRAVTNTMKTTKFGRLARTCRSIYKCKRGATWTRTSRRFWSDSGTGSDRDRKRQAC